MAKRPTSEYLTSQSKFLEHIAEQDGIRHIAKGVLYRVLRSSEGGAKPKVNSVVGVRYKGELSSGKVFDSTLDSPYPETFRLREVVEGWQIALVNMRVGDIWKVYIPAEVGYGMRTIDDIPGGSVLIFEIELLSVN